MNVIDINYDTLMYVAIALFALSGFLRGWWREGLTTIFLVLLVIFLTQPELAQNIIEMLNTVFETVWGLFGGLVGSVAGGEAVSAAADTTPPVVLDPNDQALYVAILIAIVLVSYFTSKITLGGQTISLGARIFGGILGAINGFMAVNLVKEFIVGRFLPEGVISATAAAPDTLSVTLSDVPPENVFTSTPLMLVIGLGLVVMALVLANRVTRKGGRTPWGYG